MQRIPKANLIYSLTPLALVAAVILIFIYLAYNK